MNNFFSKWLFFVPVRLMRGENILKYMKEARMVESFNEKELRSFQLHKLQRLVSEAKKIPYLSKNKELESVNAPKDPSDILSCFPIIDKAYLIKNLEQFRNKNVYRVSSRGTSGSTGQPFNFYRDRFSMAYMDAVMYNAYAWHGIAAGERQARFWGMPFEGRKRREAILKDFLMNRIRLSAFNLTDTMFYRYYLKMCKFHPGYLYGYPSLINEFAQFCRDRNYSFQHLDIKAVIVTGEKLVKSQQDVMEDVFDAKVVQEYGCSEIGVVGFDCPHGKMHVISPNVIVEVVKNGHAVIDEPGEIVVTELNARSFPFIRYKLGDLGVFRSSSCTCGLSWPVIEIKEGRIDDYIITPEGTKVYDAVLAYTFNGYKDYITMFKAVQRKSGDLDIKVVVTDKCNDDVLSRCCDTLKQRISRKININFIKVKKIEREKSGKLRYFVSEIT